MRDFRSVGRRELVDPASRDQGIVVPSSMGWVDPSSTGWVDPSSKAAAGWIAAATMVVASMQGCSMVELLVAEGAYCCVGRCVPSCKNNHKKIDSLETYG